MRLTVRLTTYEGGRLTVRTWGADVADGGGVFLDRLELLADGSPVLSLPLGLQGSHDDEARGSGYEPGELAQPGTYGGEVFDEDQAADYPPAVERPGGLWVPAWVACWLDDTEPSLEDPRDASPPAGGDA